MRRSTKSEASVNYSTVTEETNVIQLPVSESGKRGFIRSKSGWVWEYTPQTCGNEPRLVMRGTASKYTKEKRNEDNDRVKRSYRLTT